MRVIRWERDSHYDDFIKVIPIGDIHIGAAACNEKLLQKVVNKIKEEPNTYWICMGDVAEFINIQDPRFSMDSLAKWMKTKHLSDLIGSQIDRFSDYIAPIASKCMVVVEGNHERKNKQKIERDVHLEVVNRIKDLGGMPKDKKLSLGYYGWLQLVFRRGRASGNHGGTSTFNLNIHHGFGGGRTAGSKANNMQKWLWQHNADLVIFGHTHTASWQPEAVEEIDSRGMVKTKLRQGCYSGTFLATTAENSTTYSEEKGFPTMPLSGVEIKVSPFKNRSLKVTGIGNLGD